jgi:hypothetical protein
VVLENVCGGRVEKISDVLGCRNFLISIKPISLKALGTPLYIGSIQKKMPN